MDLKSKIILISGPTASGKSKFAVQLAKKINGEVINADSMQIFKELKILTARPKRIDLKNIKHHLYGFKSVKNNYSTGNWLKDAKLKIDNIKKKNKTPILVGGTGLYFKAIINGISKIPNIKKSDRNKVRNIYQKIGKKKFYQKLLKIDPLSKNKFVYTDTQRVLRAYEVMKFTKKSLYEWAKETRSLFKKYEIKKIFINTPRKQLLKNIEIRTQSMMKENCIQEVKKFTKKKLSSDLTANKIIGVREIKRFLQGEFQQKTLVDLINIKTRQYAKRQKTWSRGHMADWHMIYSSNSSILLKKILNLIS